MKQKAFTLLEILLVIAAIGILAAIVIVAINPQRQLAQVRDTERQSNVNALAKALDQYLIDQGQYSTGITNSYQPVCNEVITTDCLDFLGGLVSTYLASIPTDPDPLLPYYVALSPENDKVSVYASGVEVANEISVNRFVDLRSVDIEIDNTANSNTLTNYQVAIALSYIPGMESNFSDVRFRNTSEQELDFWLEDFTPDTNATFWVKVDSVAANSTTDIQAVYYDTNSFSTNSSIAQTFIPNQIYLESRNTSGFTNSSSGNNSGFENFISNNLPLFGSGYVTAINQTSNPYGSNDDFFLRYRFLFDPNTATSISFLTNSDDASEIKVRGTADTNSNTIPAHWYGLHASSGNGCSTGGVTGSISVNKPQWIDYRMHERGGGAVAQLCMNLGSGLQIASTSNFSGQIFSRQYVTPEPVVNVNQ